MTTLLPGDIVAGAPGHVAQTNRTHLRVDAAPIAIEEFGPEPGDGDWLALFDTAFAEMTDYVDNEKWGGYVGLQPHKKYRVSDTVVVPYQCSIRGQGRTTSAIAPLDGDFPADTPVVQLGATGSAAFHTRLEHLGVDCEDIADIGVFSDNANENAGIYNCIVRRFMKKGAHFGKTLLGSTAQSFDVRDVEFNVSTDAGGAPAICLHLDLYSTSWGSVRNISCLPDDGLTFVENCTGVQLDGAFGTMEHPHVEQMHEAIAVGKEGPATGTLIIDPSGGAGVANLIHIYAEHDTTNVQALSCRPNGAVAIRNDFTGYVSAPAATGPASYFMTGGPLAAEFIDGEIRNFFMSFAAAGTGDMTHLLTSQGIAGNFAFVPWVDGADFSGTVALSLLSTGANILRASGLLSITADPEANIFIGEGTDSGLTITNRRFGFGRADDFSGGAPSAPVAKIAVTLPNGTTGYIAVSAS